MRQNVLKIKKKDQSLNFQAVKFACFSRELVVLKHLFSPRSCYLCWSSFIKGSYFFCFGILRQNLAVQPRLTLNSREPFVLPFVLRIPRPGEDRRQFQCSFLLFAVISSFNGLWGFRGLCRKLPFLSHHQLWARKVQRRTKLKKKIKIRFFCFVFKRV